MVIWLRTQRAALSEHGGAGVAGEVVRREDVARLVSLDEGFLELERERQMLLDEARSQAKQMMDEAREAAQAVTAEAERIRAGAHEEGFHAGMTQALSEWHARAMHTDAEYQRVRQRMRERLAELVTQAVEQIVVSENARTLFKRALASVDRITEKATYLTVSVSPDDFKQASDVFGEFVEEWSGRGRAIKLTVQADKRLSAGSCVCETDFGLVDASLETQIRAVKAATERALGGGIDHARAGADEEGQIDQASDEDEGDEAEPFAAFDFGEERGDHAA